MGHVELSEFAPGQLGERTGELVVLEQEGFEAGEVTKPGRNVTGEVVGG